MTPLPLDPRISRHLAALGIPKDQHTFEGLARLFPAYFNVQSSGLELDVLAEILIHFVKHGVVQLPHARPVSVTEPLVPGMHVCQFYRSKEELLELLVPYFKRGLEVGEYGMWVLPDFLTVEEAVDALRGQAPDVDESLRAGRIEVLRGRDWYRDEAGKLRSWDAVLQAWVERERAALARGFKAMRITGDTSWIGDCGDLRRFLEYEKKVDEAIHATRILAVCTYSLDHCPESELSAVIGSHQRTLFKAGGVWQTAEPRLLQQAGSVLSAFRGGPV